MVSKSLEVRQDVSNLKWSQSEGTFRLNGNLRTRVGGTTPYTLTPSFKGRRYGAPFDPKGRSKSLSLWSSHDERRSNIMKELEGGEESEKTSNERQINISQPFYGHIVGWS